MNAHNNKAPLSPVSAGSPLSPRPLPSHSTFFKGVTAIATLLAAVVLPLYAYKVSLKNDYTDFEVYYRAAERVKNLQWDQIYNLQDGASPYRYAPIFIPFFRPFASLPLPQAQLLWYFLQYFWFGLGFFWIYRTLRFAQKPRQNALGIASLGFLFILRFCLDTFTIGQVSSLMFLGTCFSLYAWVLKKPALFSAGLFFPTVLKIGPGFLFGIYSSGHWPALRRAFFSFVFLFLGVGIFSTLWIELHRPEGISFLSTSSLLWSSWIHTVASDSLYYDASHYGSQSIKSFLLRGIRSGWLPLGLSSPLYLMSAVLVCLGIFLFWSLRRPKSLQGRGLFFSLGLFAPIWLMPETFKYSLTPLAIPVVFLFGSPKKNAFTWFSLIFGIFVLSLSGKDIVGDVLFFGSQRYSLPLFATIFLGIAVFRAAWDESYPLFQMKRRLLGPWKTSPRTDLDKEVSLLIPIALEGFGANQPAWLAKVIRDLEGNLRKKVGNHFEMIPILYGSRFSPLHPIYVEVEKLGREFKNFRILASPAIFGRGEALREGFLVSRGKRILFASSDQPARCDSGILTESFYETALDLLDQGVELVRANRRLEDSHFKVPVSLLSLVYKRHRLGLLFNRLIRILLPVKTTDTHSGTFALSRKLAGEVFAVQSSPGFLFDLELTLVCQANGYRSQDLPISLNLENEKTFHKIVGETFHILMGLPVLFWRFRRGYYRPIGQPQGITADDWGISPGVNAGILSLAKAGVVKRVSLMANCAYLKEGLEELCSLPGIELGIHFNLTYGTPLQAKSTLASPLLEPGSKPCLIRSPARFLLHWLDPRNNQDALRAHVRAELITQLALLKTVGVQTEYLDGHHHIHLVPGLISEIADILKKEKIQKVRLPYDLSLLFTKQAPLIVLSLLVRGKLRKLGFRSLPCIYPQQGAFQDHGRLRAVLSRHLDAEVIVHPAEKDDLGTLEFPDSYTQGRVTEFLSLRMLEKTTPQEQVR